jgi:hypothetical protein
MGLRGQDCVGALLRGKVTDELGAADQHWRRDSAQYGDLRISSRGIASTNGPWRTAGRLVVEGSYWRLAPHVGVGDGELTSMSSFILSVRSHAR